MKSFCRQLLFAGPAPSRASAILLLVLLSLLFVWIYTAARTHARVVNTNIINNDQKKFVILGMKLRESDYRYVIPRQRGPGYPYFISLFHEHGMETETLFARSKHAGIVLALALLGVIFFFSLRFLPPPEAALMTLIPGLIVFPMKAGYVQPELAVSTLVFITAVLLACMIRRPTWPLAVAAAASLALWHFLKPSTLGILVLFLACFALKQLWSAWRAGFEAGGRKDLFRALLLATLVPVVFVALQFPYLKKSYEIFGDPFYSAYTKYYMWLDNREQTIRFGELGAAKQPLDLPPEERPGPLKYVREHSLSQIASRPFEGLVAQLRFAEVYYPGYRFFFLFLGAVAAALAVFRFTEAKRYLAAHFFEALFAGSFFCIYFLLYGWYAYIGFGPRFIISISLVPLFCLILWNHRLASGWTTAVAGESVSVRKAINLVTAVFLGWFAWGILSGNVLRTYAGG